MAAAREFLGYLMGAIYASVGMLMMVLAWIGMDKVFGWQLALALLTLSLLVRINFFVLLGSFLFANHVWGFPPVQAAVFMVPAIMFLAPSIMSALFSAVSRPQTHY